MDSFERGYEDYQLGKQLTDSDNPFPVDSDDYYAWIRGWVNAMDLGLPKKAKT